MTVLDVVLDVPNLSDDVKGRVVQFGWRDDWPDPYGTADIPCPECGDPHIFHICVPVASDKLDFFRGLVLTDGDWKGRPFEPVDWVAENLVTMFAAMFYDPEVMGGRHVRLSQEFIGSITRGGMKTEMEAGLCCDFLFHAPIGATGLFAQQSMEEAVKKIVPRIIYMIEESPVMQGLDIEWVGNSSLTGGKYRFVRNRKYIKGIGEANLFLASPKKPTDAKGPRYDFGVFDEVGFMLSSNAETLIEEAAKKSVMSEEGTPMWWQFSTQTADSTHYQRRMVAIALQVAKKPDTHPRLRSSLYVRGLDTDIDDPAVWREMSPLLKLDLVSIRPWETENLACQYDATLRTIFARERCGVTGDFSARFIPMDAWNSCAVDKKTLNKRAFVLDKMKGLEVFCGCDFSEVSDLSSFVLFAEDHFGRIYVVGWHWIPETAFARLDALTKGQVSLWENEGWLEVLPAGEEMPTLVAQRCLEIVKPIKDDIVKWGYDKWHATDAAVIWRNAGWAENEGVKAIPQDHGLSAPIKEAPIKAQHGLILHPGDPVMDYAVQCATHKRSAIDTDKVRLVKADREIAAERIDPVIAWMTAWQAAKYHAFRESEFTKTSSIPEPYIPKHLRKS